MKQKIRKKIHILEKRYLEVTKNSCGAHIVVPKSLIGQEVEITFHRKLTEEEIKKIELLKLKRELNIIRNKRQYAGI